jgi:hypothetical protein
MSENRYNPGNKSIRFINSEYQTLFTIPDGGFINITLNNGELITRKCSFCDETHTQIGSEMYHICQFAGIMERNGNTYEPCPEPESVQG